LKELKFSLEFKPKAVKDQKRIPKDQIERILENIEKLQFGLQGDIKRLTDFTPKYRLIEDGKKAGKVANSLYEELLTIMNQIVKNGTP